MPNKKKNNYPPERKKRDASYSITQQLVNKYGNKFLYDLWLEKGGYATTARYLMQETGLYVTNMMIKYLADKNNWVKYIYSNNVPPFYRPAIEGKIPFSHFKHIEYIKV